MGQVESSFINLLSYKLRFKCLTHALNGMLSKQKQIVVNSFFFLVYFVDIRANFIKRIKRAIIRLNYPRHNNNGQNKFEFWTFRQITTISMSELEIELKLSKKQLNS